MLEDKTQVLRRQSFNFSILQWKYNIKTLSSLNLVHYFGHLMRRVDSLEKTDARRDWGQEEKGTTEYEMAGWHHRLNGHEFE